MGLFGERRRTDGPELPPAVDTAALYNEISASPYPHHQFTHEQRAVLLGLLEKREREIRMMSAFTIGQVVECTAALLLIAETASVIEENTER